MEREDYLEAKIIAFAIADYVLTYMLVALVIKGILMLAGVDDPGGWDVHLPTAIALLALFWHRYKASMDELEEMELEVFKEEVQNQKEKQQSENSEK